MPNNRTFAHKFILSGVTALTLALTGCMGNAAMFRGDPGHTAVSSDSGPTSLYRTKAIHRRW